MKTTINSATTEWLRIIRDIRTFGERVSPRALGTAEILGYRSEIDARWPVVEVAARKMGYRFMCAEAAWILSGDNRVETIAPYSKEISRFSDNGYDFFGAYGLRIRDQFGHVIRTLLNDPDSRQAVITIWRPNPPGTKDVPCTVSVQFLIRNGRMHVIDTMRSSDAWLGWVYDIFNFSVLGAYVAAHLMKAGYPEDLEMGTVTLNAGSQHLYERDFEKVDVVLADPATGIRVDKPLDPREWRFEPDELISYLWDLANYGGFEDDERWIAPTVGTAIAAKLPR